MNNIYHYPPELFSLLVDTIPLLFRSKKDVLLFFKGCGTPDVLVYDVAEHLRIYRESYE